MENLLRQYLEGAFQKSEVATPYQALPFVTISREYGCPSKIIGLKLTDALNRRKKTDDPHRWKFINKEVLEAAALELNISAVQVASLLKADQKGVVLDILTFSSSYGGAQRARKVLRNVVLSLAARGNVVLVGRGAAAITHHLPNALHIRLQAPLEWRVGELSKSKGITADEARKTAIDIDNKRTRLIESLLGAPLTPHLFDLIFNYKTVTCDEIVDAILHLMESRKMV